MELSWFAGITIEIIMHSRIVDGGIFWKSSENVRLVSCGWRSSLRFEFHAEPIAFQATLLNQHGNITRQ